jgi:hypothetical protein
MKTRASIHDTNCFHLALLFAAQPDLEIETTQLAFLLNARQAEVNHSLESATEDGFFVKVGKGAGHACAYTAGPRLGEVLALYRDFKPVRIARNRSAGAKRPRKVEAAPSLASLPGRSIFEIAEGVAA